MTGRRCGHHTADVSCPQPEEYVVLVQNALSLDGIGQAHEPWELGACAEHTAMVREQFAANVVSVRSVPR